MLGSFASLAYQSLGNMQAELGSVVGPGGSPGSCNAEPPAADRPDAPPPLRPIAPQAGSVLARGVVQGATLAMTLLLAAAPLLPVGNREITAPERGLELPGHLPLPLSTLVVSKLGERIITNHTGLLIMAPFLSVLAWWCGYRWTAPLLGVGFTLAFLVLVGTVQMLIDTGLRLALSPPQLRNFQAALSVLSLFPLLLVMSMALPANSIAFAWASALPAATAWLPTGLAVQALSAADARTMAISCVLMAAEIAVLAVAGVALLRWQLRNGVVAAGAREAGLRRGHAPRPRASSPLAPAARAPGWLDALPALSAVQRREVRLLGRDRNFMVQTLLLPAVIVGMQIFLNVRSNIFVGAMDDPANLAAIAFLLLAYTLAFSAFQTLNAEGQALWILYCVPHSLESVLRQKARLWAAVAAIYPVVIFSIAIVVAGRISLSFIGCAAIVLAGVPIFAAIATALGVFGCNPLAQDVQKRLRVTFLYLYMMLASLYAYAIYASDIWQRLTLMVLTGLVATALAEGARAVRYPARSVRFAAGARVGVRRPDRRAAVLRPAGDPRPRRWTANP